MQTVIAKGNAISPMAPATELLDEYQRGASFFFASPYGTLLAQGKLAGVSSLGEERELELLSDRVAQMLQEVKTFEMENPIVVGALPFNNSTPTQLIMPKRLHRTGPLHFEAIPRNNFSKRPVLTPRTIQMIPQPVDYELAVIEALDRFDRGELEKVVLSRMLQIQSSTEIDTQLLLKNLARRNSQGYTFAVDLPQKKTLIGASPELLVSKSGKLVVANPLAGSSPRSHDPIEDRARAEALLKSKKDLHEHAVVIDAVAKALRPHCKKLEIPSEPSVIYTETMWHLSTLIRGELLDEKMTSLMLSSELHPTPAVCGYPMVEAREAIGELEPFDRRFFTGMVGWTDSKGDGEWIVTIRCAEIEDRVLRLYAGAGIVTGSEPEKELAETSAKFRTMLNAMGLNPEFLNQNLENVA